MIKPDADQADLPVFIDWTKEELMELGKLVVTYSGHAVLEEAIRPIKPRYSLKRLHVETPKDFIINYSHKEKLCATSWVSSVIEVAEAAVNGAYKFSHRQLMECLSDYFDLDSGCHGVHPMDLIRYLNEVGLVEEKHFDGCNSLDEKPKIRFQATRPQASNKGGLMNLVAEGVPVFVMVALDLPKLQFVKGIEENAIIKAAAYQPSMYGIVTGYDSDDDTPYWEIASRIVSAEETIIRIPMVANDTNANYAGIAGYAFSLSEIFETDSEDINSQ